VAIHGTQGTDRYTIGPLQNGWVLHSFSTSYGGCCAPSVDYFNPGATTANLAVRWQLGGSFGFVGQVGFYIVDVYITGPLGVGF
jgi:hypothetical protein